MTELDHICLHEGIGVIRFGASKDDVIDILGTEFEEESFVEGHISISYPDHQVTFTFWEDFDLRLGYIGTERKSAKLLGESLIGLRNDRVKTFITESLKCPITEESGCEHEDGHIQEWLDVDDKSLVFWFTDDVLYQIEWSCAWVDGDTPDWPKVRI